MLHRQDLLLQYQTSSMISRRKTASRLFDMRRLSLHQTAADQIPARRQFLRRSNTNNNKSRRCALHSKLSNNSHSRGPNQQDNRTTRNNSSNSNSRLYRSSSSHQHKPLRLVPHLDLGKGLDNQSPTLRSSVSCKIFAILPTLRRSSAILSRLAKVLRVAFTRHLKSERTSASLSSR